MIFSPAKAVSGGHGTNFGSVLLGRDSLFTWLLESLEVKILLLTPLGTLIGFVALILFINGCTVVSATACSVSSVGTLL